MRDGRTTLGVVALSLCLFLLSTTSLAAVGPTNGTASQGAAVGWGYPTNSWGLGVVVPEGASLQGGTKLLWEEVGNVTAMVTLPNIIHPDGIVYAVLSLMAEDGSVLQVAAGVYPNSSSWLAYSWYIGNIGTIPLSYTWILNSSEPRMTTGDLVSMSIFRSQGAWRLEVADLATGGSVERPFPSAAPSLRVGDQEVFAFESYSRTAATFQNMGNLTLNSLLVDGQRVVGGFYSYAVWDPNRNPVFAVGGSGTSPPDFIFLQQPVAGTFVWGYSGSWEGTGAASVGMVGAGVLALLIGAALAAVAGAYLLTRRPAQRPGRWGPREV